jgi:ABC-type multidrug transport system fused ATPase/permease subunit
MMEKRGLIGYFKRFSKYLEPYKGRYAISLLAGFLAIALFNIQPYLFKILIDDVLIAKSITGLWIVIIAYFLTSGFGLILGFVDNYINMTVRERFSLDLNLAMFKKLEWLGMTKVKEKDEGTLLTTLIDDAEAVKSYTFSLFDDILPEIFVLIYIFMIMAFLSWKLTLLGLLIIPLLIVSQRHYGRILNKTYMSYRKRYSAFFSYLGERIHQLKQIKLFNREDYEKGMVRKKGMLVMEKTLQLNFQENVAYGVSTGLSYLSMIFMIIVGGYEVIFGELTIGALVAITSYYFILVASVGTLFGKYLELKEQQVSCKRVVEILDCPNPIKDPKRGTVLKKTKGVVELSNVTFSFGPDKVLKDVSLTLKPGIVYGLVGDNGSGKTTLVNLIYRIYDPTEGAVKIDGIDVRKIKLDSLRKNIAVMESQPFLFNTTVRANLQYGSPEVTLREIKKAAELVGIHKFIMSLPHGYDTDVGSYGTRFSEGQKEMLGLARVILKDAQVILLDEATALLDPKNRERIMQVVEELKKRGKTVLVITNKQMVAKKLEYIYFLDKGRVKYEGKPQDFIS